MEMEGRGREGKGVGGGGDSQGKGRGVWKCLDSIREPLLAWSHGSFWEGAWKRSQGQTTESLQPCSQEPGLDVEAEGPCG